MRQHLSFRIFILSVLMALLPMAAGARPTYGTSHFSSASNYDAYSMGNGKIHYKVLLYGKGSSQDGYAGETGDPNQSNVWTKIGNGANVPFLKYNAWTDRNHPGLVSGQPEDQAVVWLTVLEGVVVVTNPYSGSNIVLDGNNSTIYNQRLELSRSTSGDVLTYLEFDW